MKIRSLIVASLLFVGCTATVSTPPPASPAPPPPEPAPPPPVATAPAPAPAPAPPPMAQKHPAYLHALADLRAARANLAKPANVVVKWDEQKAINEIDVAMKLIRDAAIDDGKPLDDHPPVDVATWGGRLQRSLEFLEKANVDVSQEEDNPANHQLRAQALEHIGKAARHVKEGVEDARNLKEPPPPPPPGPGAKPGIHPAYLDAMAKLRHARALLEKPANADVKWDEQNGIREIDAALKEIHDARIDDGKPLTEHPPIENAMMYRDRLREATKMLNEAARDIEEREDNVWVKADRHRAVEHIRNAEHAVKEAAEERKEEHGKKH